MDCCSSDRVALYPAMLYWALSCLIACYVLEQPDLFPPLDIHIRSVFASPPQKRSLTKVTGLRDLAPAVRVHIWIVFWSSECIQMNSGLYTVREALVHVKQIGGIPFYRPFSAVYGDDCPTNNARITPDYSWSTYAFSARRHHTKSYIISLINRHLQRAVRRHRWLAKSFSPSMPNL